MVRVVVRTSRLRCALCHDGAGPELLVTCGGCATWLHLECRTGLGRCPTRGCAASARTHAQRPTWRRVLDDVVTLVLVLGLGVVATLVVGALIVLVTLAGSGF